MSPPAKPRGNLAASSLSRVLTAVTGVLVLVAVRRSLGEEGFGVYRWLSSLSALSLFGATFGLQLLITRRVAREPHEATHLLRTSIRTVLGLSVVTGVAMLGWIGLMDGRASVALAGGFASAALAATALTMMYQAVFQGLRRFALELPGVIAGAVVLLVTQVSVAWWAPSIEALWAGRALAGFTTVALFAWSWRRVAPATWEPTDAGPVQLLRGGWAFAATSLFGAIYAQADILMLQALRDDAEVGRYAAPAAILLQTALLANTLSRAVYPRMAKHLDAPEAATRELTLLTRMLLLLSAPIAVGGIIVAEPLMVGLFGADAAPSTLPFVWLCAAMPLRFANNGYGLTLGALNRQGPRWRIDSAGAAFNLAANAVAIPWYGASGAAATTLLTDLLLNLLLYRQLAHVTSDFRATGIWVRAMAPAAAMGLVVHFTPGGLVLRVAVGVATYSALSLLSGAWTRQDPRALLRL